MSYSERGETEQNMMLAVFKESRRRVSVLREFIFPSVLLIFMVNLNESLGDNILVPKRQKQHVNIWRLSEFLKIHDKNDL